MCVSKSRRLEVAVYQFIRAPSVAHKIPRLTHRSLLEALKLHSCSTEGLLGLYWGRSEFSKSMPLLKINLELAQGRYLKMYLKLKININSQEDLKKAICNWVFRALALTETPRTNSEVII